MYYLRKNNYFPRNIQIIWTYNQIVGNFTVIIAYYFFLSSFSLLPHLGACSRLWSIGLSFLSFLIRDRRQDSLDGWSARRKALYLYTNIEKHTHIHKH
jgi:hypothetical protein